MSTQTYTHRSTTCSHCTREVWAYIDVPDPVLCEYCSGGVKPLHQEWAEERARASQEIQRSDSVAFLQRVDSFLGKVLPNPQRPGALGYCPYCGVAFVLQRDKIVHPGGPCSGRKA